MKLLRQFAAVAATVAVIVGLGLVWAHAAGGGPALRQPPPHAVLVRIGQVKAAGIPVRADDGIHLANSGDLVKTGVIEAALASVVVAVSATRRRRRRRHRLRQHRLRQAGPP